MNFVLSQVKIQKRWGVLRERLETLWIFIAECIGFGIILETKSWKRIQNYPGINGLGEIT